MKVIIIVYDNGEWARDTLETRMVDVRIEAMVAEFTRNHVPIEVIRQEEVKEWEEPTCSHEELDEVGLLKSGLILLKCTSCPHLLVTEKGEFAPREPAPEDFEEGAPKCPKCGKPMVLKFCDRGIPPNRFVCDCEEAS